jgi:putative ABC transport system permease protein
VKTLALKRRRDIGRQKWQFIAVVVTVTLGVSMFAGTFNAYLNLGSSMESTYERLAMADNTVVGTDEGFVDTVAGLDGVATAIERRQADVPFAIGEYSFLGRMVAMPAPDQPDVNQVDIDEGTYLDPSNSTGVVVEAHAASEFELSVGDTFSIVGTEVTVIGIATSPEYLWPARDSQNLFTPPKSFGVVFVLEDVLAGGDSTAIIDQVLVLYDEDADVEIVDEAVQASADNANAASVQTLADHPSNSSLQMEVQGLRTMAIAFPLLFLLASGMAIYVVITRLVFSQRGVIGTLRATGFSSRALSNHYRSYGVGVGLVGAALGAVFGGILGRLMTAMYTVILGIPDLVAPIHPGTVIAGFVFGAVAGALAAVPPARTVARMAPAEAMRGEAPAEPGKRSIFETLIPPLRNAPVRWRMTLRGIGRNKKRSASMVLGVVLAMTLILAAWGMVDTMLLAIDRQFTEIALEDATVVHGVPVGEDQLAAVSETIGVEHAEPVIGLQVSIHGNGESYSTILEGYAQDTKVHGFETPLPLNGMFVGQAMQDILQVNKGDSVTVRVPAFDTEFTTTIEGFVDEPLGTMAYMNIADVVGTLGEANPAVTSEQLAAPGNTTIKAQFEDGQGTSVVIDRIKDLDGVAAVIDATLLRELVEEFQIFFYAFAGMMLIFGGAMAFALIFNTISVNVAERSGEFASMRANGLTHSRVAAMIAGENLLLTAMGILPGALVGYLAAVAFMGSFSSDQFPLTANVRPVSYLAAAAAMFVVAGLSLIPAVRAVKRINVGEIVRERSV